MSQCKGEGSSGSYSVSRFILPETLYNNYATHLTVGVPQVQEMKQVCGLLLRMKRKGRCETVCRAGMGKRTVNGLVAMLERQNDKKKDKQL